MNTDLKQLFCLRHLLRLIAPARLSKR